MQRSGGGSLFHARGPAAAKDRSPSDECAQNVLSEPGRKQRNGTP